MTEPTPTWTCPCCKREIKGDPYWARPPHFGGLPTRSMVRALAAARDAEYAETGLCPRCGLDQDRRLHYWSPSSGWTPVALEFPR